MIAKPKSNLLPHEVLKLVTKAKTTAAKVKVLQDNESFALKTLIQGNFDPRIVLDIPEGAPPYKKDESPAGLQLSRVDSSIKILGKLVVGSSLAKMRKEMLFIQLLEGIHAEDAELVIAMKDKKLTDICPTLTIKVAEKAFPTLFPA
jgi:hypothetical protein